MRLWFRRQELFRKPVVFIRVVLGIGILAGVLTVLFYGFLRPDPNISFDIYYYTAHTAIEGAIEFDTPSGAFVYPPVVAIAFYPFTALEFSVAFAVYRLFNIVLAIGIGVATAGYISRAGRALCRIDWVLIVGFFVVTVYPISILVIGQVEILLATGLVLGYLAVERDREGWAGVSFAVPAVIKVAPTLWGLWFLRERAWRAIITATITGIGSIAIGVLVFGIETHMRYLRFVRNNRIRITEFTTPVSPDREFLSLMRPFSFIFSETEPHVYPLIALILVGPVVFLLYRTVETDRGRIVAFLATVIGIILVIPTSQDLNAYQVYFPAITALYLLDDDRVRSLIGIGIVLMSFNFDPGELETVLGLIGPPEIQSAVLEIATPILTFASMPLYGLVIMFLGCAVYAVLVADRESQKQPRLARQSEN